MANNIGVELLRFALEDADIKQQKIERLVRNSNTGDDLINLTNQQTALVKSIVVLFNRIY
jgi:hypothetical protein